MKGLIVSDNPTPPPAEPTCKESLPVAEVVSTDELIETLRRSDTCFMCPDAADRLAEYQEELGEVCVKNVDLFLEVESQQQSMENLKEYVQHKYKCKLRVESSIDGYVCDCGLAEALKELEKTNE